MTLVLGWPLSGIVPTGERTTMRATLRSAWCTAGASSPPRAATMTTTTATAREETGGDGGGSSDFTACQVTDTGGVDDRLFNQTAYAGVEQAATRSASNRRCWSPRARPTSPQHPGVRRPGLRPDRHGRASCSATPPPRRPRRTPTRTSRSSTTTTAPRPVTTATSSTTSPSCRSRPTRPPSWRATCRGHDRDRHRRHLRRHQHPHRDHLHEGLRGSASSSTTRTNGTDVQLIGWSNAEDDGLFTGDFENQANGRATTESSSTRAPTSSCRWPGRSGPGLDRGHRGRRRQRQG